ncbi:hypothetical protein CANARDRAFT_27431 [[Candida] arabinofermentans NRRL YB-2248]|uniref:Clathrin light chain n=1 Tax=[Candida] arabinofermentans NRRL YB-2248 TaxID=983967 RepID=A0A1E4T3C6_9ASCO|nr:hypothetical protein CANARDRAFT_27431 [[Candida] arabinofermentans NRRL YB-2248]
MADKYPQLDDVADETEVGGSSDFLSREKELLGDEFATEQDKDLEQDDEDDEFNEFESQFPEVSTSEAAAAAPAAVESEDEYETSEPTSNVLPSFSNLNLDESEHIKEWKKTRDLELTKRDEISANKLEELKGDAEKAIDDFYENYNNKKEAAIEVTRKEAEEFLSKIDGFLEKGTVWDRSIELLNLNKNSNSVDAANHRDKTKFKDLLLALKGKEQVPGAAGY